MFGIGTTELIVILVVALIILGPKKLPEIARSLGKGMAEFKRVSTDFQGSIEREVEREDMERRKTEAEKTLSRDTAAAESVAATAPKPDAATGAAPDTSLEPETVTETAEAANDAPAEAGDTTPETPKA